MRLSLRPPTGRSVVQVDADGAPGASRVLTTLNAPTHAPLPTPTPRWSLASLALRALAGSLGALELELDPDDGPTLGLAPRADVLADLLPSDAEEDPRIWSALALAYGQGVGAVRRMPLSDAHLFALPQPVVLDFSGMPFDDGAARALLAADLRALVLLDLSGQPALTDRGLLTLARATGTRGVRALALRGCSGVGLEGVRACALAWERLEVLDVRGTGVPTGTPIPGFAPRPPALLADSRFHPRSPEQIARALLGKDVPFILVDEEDFGRPARRRDRPRLVVPAVEPEQPAPRVFTSSSPASGVLLVERPQPPPPPPEPEPALPPEPTTMDELRARRLAAFGVAPPAPPAAQPEPSRPAPPPLPPASSPAAHPPASAWTRAPRRDMVLWDDILARHQPPRAPRPAPRASLSIPKGQRMAAAAPAPAPALAATVHPAAPPPAKRRRVSNAYANPCSSADANALSSADVTLAIPSSSAELAQPAKRTKPRASQAALTEKYEARARARQDGAGPRPAPRASLSIPKEERMAAAAAAAVPPQPSSSHLVDPPAKCRRVSNPFSVADANPPSNAELARPSSSAGANPSPSADAMPPKRTKPRASQAVLTEKYEARARARQERAGPRPAPRASLSIPKEVRMAAAAATTAPPQPRTSADRIPPLRSVDPPAKRRRVSNPYSSADTSPYADADVDAYFDAESDAGSAVSEPGPYVYIEPTAYSSDEGSDASDWKPHFWADADAYFSIGPEAYYSDEGSDAQPARPPPIAPTPRSGSVGPPAKRARVANPYSSADSKLANPGEGKRKGKPSKEEEKAALAERARFAARLADDGALMFVRVAPPPLAPSSSSSLPFSAGPVVPPEQPPRVKQDAGVRAHLAGVLSRRVPSGGAGAGAGAGVSASVGASAAVSGGASASAEVPAASGSTASAGVSVGAEAAVSGGASTSTEVARRVPFARAAHGVRRGLSTWHGVAPAEDEDEDEEEVVEVAPPPSRSAALKGTTAPSSKLKSTGSKTVAQPSTSAKSTGSKAATPAMSAAKSTTKPAAKSTTKPAAKPAKMPSLNSSSSSTGAKQVRQTTLSFAKKPPASKG